MANYTTNIVKIYVPEIFSSLVDQIAAALASPSVDRAPTRDRDARYADVGEWIDFRRLVPLHPVFACQDDASDFRAAASLNENRWPHDMDRPQEMPGDAEGKIAAAIAARPELLPFVEEVRERIQKAGTAYRVSWQEARWGVKWNPGDMSAPDIFPASGYGGLDDKDGCTVLSYEFSTTWNEPVGYAEALSQWCRSLGLGMQWWYSHEDGGSALNPRTNEIETVWTEYDEVRVEIEELSHIDQAALIAGGIPNDVVEPDTTPIDPEDQPW